MRRTILFLFSLILSISLGLAQDKPTMTFDKTVHDFGQVLEANGDVSCEFVVKNTGKTPLVISNVTASCGCTTPAWTKEPIAPGKTGFIKATYSTKGRIGPFTKTITIYSNDAAGSAVLTIKGEVLKEKPNVEATHPVAMGTLRLKTSTVDLSWINKNESKNESIEVLNTSSSPMTLTFEGAPKYLSIATEPVAIQPYSVGKILISCDAKKVKDYGYQTAKLNVVINNDKKDAAKNILEINSTVVDDFSSLTLEQKQNAPHFNVSAVTMDFGAFGNKAQATLPLKIANSGKTNLIVRSIQASSGEISINGKNKVIAPGDIVEFNVTVHPKNTSQAIDEKISIVTNDPENFLREIRVTANKS